MRILILLFFLGLPFAGLMLFWKDAHRRIEASATPFATKVTDDILKGWDKQLLDDLGTRQFRDGTGEKEFDGYKVKYGKYSEMSDWKLVKSIAGSREDMVWQFVYFSGKAQFEKGSGTVNVTLARRTMSPEWRIETFEIQPR